MTPSDATIDTLIEAIEAGDLTADEAAAIAATLPSAPDITDES